MNQNGVRTSEFDQEDVVDDILANKGQHSVRVPVSSFITQIMGQVGPPTEKRSDLYANLNWPEGALASVFGDVIDVYNGVYTKVGASGGGSWTRIGPLPTTYLALELLARKADLVLLEAETENRIAGDAANITGANFSGGWDASTGAFPSVRKLGGAVQQGDSFQVSVAGTFGGTSYASRETIRALKDAPSSTTLAGNWEHFPIDASLAPILDILDAAALPIAKFADLAGLNYAKAPVGQIIQRTDNGGLYISKPFGSTDFDFNYSGWLVSVLPRDDGSFNPDDFGAVGDGITYDTVPCQAALNKSFFTRFTKPEVGYLVSQLTVSGRRHIVGPGKDVDCLIGNGSGTTLTCGDGVGGERAVTIYNLKVYNDGDQACHFDLCPDSRVTDCFFQSVGGGALSMWLSVRSHVTGSKIISSGTGTALSMINNCNGSSVTHSTITGGQSGRAFQLEQSQNVEFTNNTIEGSLHGCWVASTSDTGAGNCNGLVMHTNHIEQCSTPFVFGLVNTVFGLSCYSNFISNADTNVISARTAAITHGRLIGADITKNSIHVASDGSEDVLSINLRVLNDDIRDVLWAKNEVAGTPNSLVVRTGTYAENAAVNNNLGAKNTYDFGALGGVNEGYRGTQEYISPTLQANVTTGDLYWSVVADRRFGGKILAVDIIDAVGSLTGCKVRLGDSVNSNVNVSDVDLTTLTYVGGRAEMMLASADMDGRASGLSRYAVTGGSGAGSFRVRIKYEIG